MPQSLKSVPREHTPEIELSPPSSHRPLLLNETNPMTQPSLSSLLHNTGATGGSGLGGLGLGDVGVGGGVNGGGSGGGEGGGKGGDGGAGGIKNSRAL